MGWLISSITLCSLLLINSIELTNFLGYGLSSRKGKHSTALCVSPPPQGFSQARCSSKMLTLCPARANCSPHIAPEGPPPTIAISVMFGSSLRSRTRSLRANLQAKRPFRPKSRSGDRENHQAETSQKCSTEDRRRNCRSRLLSHNVHPQPLKQEEERKVQRQQDHQDSSAVQHENPKEQRNKSNRPHRQGQPDSRLSAARRYRTQQKFLRKQVCESRHKQRRETSPTRPREPSFCESSVEPGSDQKVQSEGGK